MPRIIFIACKIRHKPPHSQMFSDYLVIIQTSKDKGETDDPAVLSYVNVCEKNIAKAMVYSKKSTNFAEDLPIYNHNINLTKSL